MLDKRTVLLISGMTGGKMLDEDVVDQQDDEVRVVNMMMYG